MAEKRSARAAFVLAGVAAVTAAVTWVIGLIEAREITAACNNQFTLFADLADCRVPALYGAISWVLFTGAIASGWVGGVRLARNSNTSEAARSERDRRAPPPHDAQPT